MQLPPKWTVVGIWPVARRPNLIVSVLPEPLDRPMLHGLAHREMSDVPSQRFAAPIGTVDAAATSRTGGLLRLFQAALRRRQERRTRARLGHLPNHLRKDIGLPLAPEPNRQRIDTRYAGLR